MDYYVKSVIPIIESNYENFTALEKNIADFFMKNEEKMDFSAKEIAKHLFVSEASLSRFAKKCGFRGYREFIYQYEEAFEEKNKFFKEHKEDACAVWNLAKWNRAIILKYRNEGANEEQRNEMMQQFKTNFKELCGYTQFKLKTRIYFQVFMTMPMM